jgi:D-tyrosyl-tRNA(Tyr) deacylase
VVSSRAKGKPQHRQTALLCDLRGKLSLIYGAVSQFTLLASTKKGSKPDFHGALGGEEAKRLYQYFYRKVQEGYQPERVKDGVFQAMMEVALVNDGPVSELGYACRLAPKFF